MKPRNTRQNTNPPTRAKKQTPQAPTLQRNQRLIKYDVKVEPPEGIEPSTYSLVSFPLYRLYVLTALYVNSVVSTISVIRRRNGVVFNSSELLQSRARGWIRQAAAFNDSVSLVYALCPNACVSAVSVVSMLWWHELEHNAYTDGRVWMTWLNVTQFSCGRPLC